MLLALADAADDDGSVRTTRQHIADRARVNRATVSSAMAMLFKSGELLRYDAEVPDSALCIVVCVRNRDKSEACDIPNSGVRKFEADDAGNEFSDLQNVDDWTQRRRATSMTILKTPSRRHQGICAGRYTSGQVHRGGADRAAAAPAQDPEAPAARRSRPGPGRPRGRGGHARPD